MKINLKRLIENFMVVSVACLFFFFLRARQIALLYFMMLHSVADRHSSTADESDFSTANENIRYFWILIVLLLILKPQTIIALALMQTISNISSTLICDEINQAVSFVFCMCLSYLYLPTVPLVANNIEYIAKVASAIFPAHSYLSKHGDITNFYGIFEDLGAKA